MIKEIKNLGWVIVLSFLAISLCANGTLFAGDAPAPGTKIDKSNYMQYKEYFPEEFLDAFTTGWELINPLSIKIIKTTPNPVPKQFMEASRKNKGKYGLDAEGYITGGPFDEVVGFPFPDISPADKDFAQKLMWNYDYRYQGDSNIGRFQNYQIRRGEPLTTSLVESIQLFYQSRIYDDPKPNYNTSSGWRDVNFIRILTPPSSRNFVNMLVRYKDQKKEDLTYVYLPTMRRVLRGEAGSRSTPINSSTQAPDDFSGGFSGKIAAFTYKFIEEKKIVAQAHAKITYSDIKDQDFDYIPVELDNWELRDVYVIDIFAKDPKYPQGRKRIWVDKETTYALYAVAYDRAGTLWKIWQTAGNQQPMAPEGTYPYFNGMLGLDIQLGYGVQMVSDWKVNGNDVTESDVNVSAMRRIAR